MAVSAYRKGKLKKRALLGTSLAVDPTREAERGKFQELYKTAASERFRSDPEAFRDYLRERQTSETAPQQAELSRLGGRLSAERASLADLRSQLAGEESEIGAYTRAGGILGANIEEAVAAHKKKKKGFKKTLGKIMKTTNPLALTQAARIEGLVDKGLSKIGIDPSFTLDSPLVMAQKFGDEFLVNKPLGLDKKPNLKRKAIAKGAGLAQASPQLAMAANQYWNTLSKDERKAYDKQYRPSSGAKKRTDPKQVQKQKAYLDYLNQQLAESRAQAAAYRPQIEQQAASVAELERQRQVQLANIQERNRLYGGFLGGI